MDEFTKAMRECALDLSKEEVAPFRDLLRALRNVHCQCASSRSTLCSSFSTKIVTVSNVL